MLYKKIHRQHLREFKVGRVFRYGNMFDSLQGIFEVAGESYISVGEEYIRVNCHPGGCALNLIDMHSHKGRIRHKDHITWLD